MVVSANVSAMRNVFIVAAKRTPFGSFGGCFTSMSATDLAVESTKAALHDMRTTSSSSSSSNGDEIEVDAVVFGNVLPTSSDGAYLSRHVGLKSDAGNVATPALTINRLCGSGFEALIQGTDWIRLGRADVVVCGGTENMTQSPHVVYGQDLRFSNRGHPPLGKGLQLRDALWDGLTDSHANVPMGMTAENLAKKYGITRPESDAFSLRSQRLYQRAHEAGIYERELAPVEIVTNKKKGESKSITKDEHPRADSSMESLSKLKPVFDPERGVVTAASSSGICDGAATLVVASEDAVRRYGMTPLARIVSHAAVGCPPEIMGIGPVPAIRAALQQAGGAGGGTLDLHADVSRVEINEAFAAQVLACAKELELDASFSDDDNDDAGHGNVPVLNAHGGAIALGHPLGASGARILSHLAHEFHQPHASSHRIHVGAACIGGGQGIAVVLERP